MMAVFLKISWSVCKHNIKDAPETALKEVFPKIKFFKEKVSQKSDK